MTKPTDNIVIDESGFRSEQNQSTRTSSLMYSIFPSALQTGLHPLALVVRSLRDYGFVSRRNVARLAVFRNDNEDTRVAKDEVTVASSSSVSPENAEVPGICWKFARHGSHILETSLAESQVLDSQSQAFSRQLYLDAVAYLIQGLPSDLTDQETLQLKKTLPAPLREMTPPETVQPKKDSPSFLHRSLASTIIAICLLVRLALPYIKLLITAAYNYDRAHHVRARVFSFGVSAADTLGKRSMALAGTAMTNEFILRAVTYWVDGIRGGLDEGLGEGLRVIETQNEP